MTDVQRQLIRASAVVGAGTALSRLTGFLRIAVLAYVLGTTALADAYNLANETPNIVYELLLGGVLSATFVPVFVEHLERDDDEATSAVTTMALVALAAVTVAGVIAAPWIVRLYTLRLEGSERAAQQAVASDLLRLFMPQMFFYGLTAIATALLHSRRRFAAPAFVPILNNLVVIAVLLALPRVVSGDLTIERVRSDTGLLLALGLGTTAGIAAMALALLPALRRAGIALRARFDPRHPAVAKVLRLSGWTVGYVATNQVALWVVLVLANGERGGVSSYLYAYAFFQLPFGLLAVSLMTTLAPDLASAATRGDLGELRRGYSLGVRLIALVMVPAAAGYLALAGPIITALLQRGEFGATSTALTSDVLAMFALGLVPFSVYLFTLRAFYSLQDTRTPFLVNSFENGMNVVLAFALYPWLGVPGLALAFSLAYVLGAGVALVALRRRIASLDGRRLATVATRVVVAGAATALAAWAVARVLDWAGPREAVATLAVGILAGAVVYVASLAVLRVDEARLLLRRRPVAGP